ncbi:M17 family peptidase N-terminal domain-containing protein [Niameybacter massiliensis]|uniref:M17 family peptidase N-terminal domain-containing protein n=1 Tax=Niameybacter massiliensis TaxID=1658108 RepID=UPI0012B52100|nr:M17 family peptidase N-terminal domain-containing protein [Niameybacter massiliensis]
MNIIIENKKLENLQGMIIPVYEDYKSTCENIEQIKEGNIFKGKVGECFYYTTNEMKYIILVGLGKYDQLKMEAFKEAVARGAKKAKELKLDKYGIKFIDAAHMCTGAIGKAIVQGLRLSTYTFNKYKTDVTNVDYNPTVYLVDVPEEKVDKLNQRLER